ncbi:hypothetical protein K502DRAFT_366199 [Neoconidiobolus thromboides FSU 785]|nr:hypothetical protein K502DRAFT_366199 [Neoconidiobolus thromboides FSU 785]
MSSQESLILNLSRFSHTLDENLITSIKKDHNLIKYLFEEFLKLSLECHKIKLSNEIIRQISVHNIAEELTVYPVIKDKLGEYTYIQNLNEHRNLERELRKLPNYYSEVGSEGFYKILITIVESFIAHSEKEEKEILPKLIEKLTDHEKEDITKSFIYKRSKVPTRPHPGVAIKFPYKSIIATLQAPLDKFMDIFTRDFPIVSH